MMHKPNENCLQGLACPNPKCRSVGPFRIQAEALFEFTDEGASEFTEVDFNESSFMSCVKCGDEGVVAQFNVLRPLPDEDIVHVDADGRVSFETWQPEAREASTRWPRMILRQDLDRMLADVAIEVFCDQLTGLPPDYAVFMRRPDPSVDRQVLRPINYRINDEFGVMLRGPVLLVRRSLLHLPAEN